MLCCKENDSTVPLNHQNLNVTNGVASNSGDNQIFQNETAGDLKGVINVGPK